MKRYGPRRRGRRINFARLGLVIGVAVMAVVVIVLGVNKFGTKAEESPEATAEPITDRSTFEQGVSVGGVDVSGMTMDQAHMAVAPAAEQMLGEGKIEFTVSLPQEAADPEASADPEAEEDADTGESEDAEGESAEATPEPTPTPGPQSYSYTLQDLGVAADVETALYDAMQYDQPKDLPEDAEGNPIPQKQDFPIEKKVDETTLNTVVNQIAEENAWTVQPVNSNHKVEKGSDKEELTTWGKLVETEPTDGYRVKTEELVSAIEQQVQAGQYAPIEAQVEVLKSQTAAESGKEYVLMGRAETSFAGNRPDGRHFNIWKMCDILNGSVLYPGEAFSVNETAGDRNKENGWKEANGIEDGNLTPQYGGGICQVSTTMFNAALKAEIKMLSRVPHSIKSAYVKPGLDATISTGGPDFIVENNTDDPMYMIVECTSDYGVIVELYGTRERDYYITLNTKLISDDTTKVPPAQYVTNAGLPPYEVSEVRRGRRYEQWAILATYYKKSDDSVIEADKQIGTSTYNEIVGKYEVGAGVPLPAEGTPIEEVKALAASLAGAAATPDPNAIVEPVDPPPEETKTPKPTPSEEPTTVETPPVETPPVETPVVTEDPNATPAA